MLLHVEPSAFSGNSIWYRPLPQNPATLGGRGGDGDAVGGFVGDGGAWVGGVLGVLGVVGVRREAGLDGDGGRAEEARGVGCKVVVSRDGRVRRPETAEDGGEGRAEAVAAGGGCPKVGSSTARGCSCPETGADGEPLL